MATSVFAQYFRGVNLAGAEFGENSIPGLLNRDYTYNSEATFRYFASKGLNLFRVCVRWERLQPQLRGPLDAANLALLKQNAAWARAHGARIIIDIQNFGRYKVNEGGAVKEYVIDNVYDGAIRVSSNDFIDFWVRLSGEFRDDPGVYAYDLMNEPHEMGPANWKLISQAVLSAIRDTGDDTLILIPGDDWSSANRWVRTHGLQGWISDPASNFFYAAHLYFDSDESGTYKKADSDATSYETQLKLNANLATVGETRLEPFRSWCQSNGARGFLGEYGVPNDDPRWYGVLDRLLSGLDAAGLGGAYWAAGEWWGDYRLSVQPKGNFDIDRPQLPVLQTHRGAAFLTTVSAASGVIVNGAPDALVSGYGVELVPADANPAEAQVQVAGRAAPLLYVSPAQVNYLVPADAPFGRVEVSVSYGGKVTAAGSLRLERVAPALFSASGDGQGIAAAQIVGIKPDGTRTTQPATLPIDFGAASDRLFVELYGTGLRSAAEPALRIGSQAVRVLYAGRQSEYPGLDQVNAELPRALAGAGEVAVTFTADGKTANPVTLVFR